MNYRLAEQPLLTEDQIRVRVGEMAREIAADYAGYAEIRVIGLLRGAFVFMADLVRELSRAGVIIREMDFLIASSYGAGMDSSRNVKIERDLRSDIRDQAVLVIDDILDTGHTFCKVMDLLNSREPALLKSCVLLDKPSRRNCEVSVDYTGFEVENRFLVGYGLDVDQRFRELPYIAIVDSSEGDPGL